ncbi:hypothetical protein PPACK8108_LOCUS852 [Phakopsora pachyrhizi]|uniref:Uncharacterized protein n=1 Tax=Phakopsora pachyrhizi TaxID=170000 RepID=A0AAV0AFQ0_PHAPC|nr:hypothetical protein PPACK8108_LOCUS852 [Phakopsora pachyrhizi]
MLSGTKNKEIDITAIDNQKENIQPKKSGRSALKLSSLFLSKISQSCSSSSIIDSSKNNNIRIKDDDNDDDYETKLENLLRKVHLEFQRKIIILELIEKDQSIKSKAGPIITKETKDQSLIDKLRKDPLETDDQTVDNQAMMRFLPLGDDQMDLLREGEGRGVTDDGFAREKNPQGKGGSGWPPEVHIWSTGSGSRLYTSDDDSTRTREDEVCCGQNSTAEHSKQSTCTRINKGTSSNNWLKSNKFKTFEDGKDDHQIEIPGTVKSNQRQNLIEPTTWKGQKLPMKQSQVQTNQSRQKMKVFDYNIVSLLPCSDIYVCNKDWPTYMKTSRTKLKLKVF